MQQHGLDFEREARANLLMEEVNRLARMPSSSGNDTQSFGGLPRLSGALGLGGAPSFPRLSQSLPSLQQGVIDPLRAQVRPPGIPTGLFAARAMMQQAVPRVDMGSSRRAAVRPEARQHKLEARSRSAPYQPPPGLVNRSSKPFPSVEPQPRQDDDDDVTDRVQRASRNDLQSAEFLLSLSPGTSSSALDTCVSLLATPDLMAFSREEREASRIPPALPSPRNHLGGNILRPSSVKSPLSTTSPSLCSNVSTTPTIAEVMGDELQPRAVPCNGWGALDRVPGDRRPLPLRSPSGLQSSALQQMPPSPLSSCLSTCISREALTPTEASEPLSTGEVRCSMMPCDGWGRHDRGARPSS